jgi:hypothetical protein
MNRPRLRWYSVSVESLRAVALGLATLLLVVGGLLGYRWWESHSLEREAEALVGEARQLAERLETHPELPTVLEQYTEGLELLLEARSALAAGGFERAATQARRAHGVLAALADHLDGGGDDGEAHFIAVHGNVQFRRGDAASWQEARSRESLRPGDYVRTAANGSAEILFADGTLYTIKPNTSLIVSASPDGERGDATRSIRMDYGWIDMSTSRRPIQVDTPQAQARVAEESDAYVAYEQRGERGRFGARRGSIDVESRDGERVRLEASQQVVQQGGALSRPRRMRAAPAPLQPAPSQEFRRDRDEVVVLEWQPVAGARGYRLEVARDRLFADRVVEDSGRTLTRATLGIRGEGSFEWRVAAETADGEIGGWSEPRAFRVASLGSGEGDVDREPPALEIVGADRYGNIFIVGGRTDPGAIVEINGESVSVDAGGAFTKTIQLSGESWSFIVVRARDAWDNTREQRLRAYLDAGS